MPFVFKRLFAAAAIALCAASPALAQDDPVVATFDGGQVTRSEVERYHQSDPQLARQPLEAVFGQLVDSLIATKLAARQAEKAGVAEEPEVRDRLAQIRQELLAGTWLNRQIDARMTEERLKEAYGRMLEQMPSQREVKARHILLESEADAEAAIAEIEGGADFVEVAKARSTGPSASKGGDLGWFTKDRMVPAFAEAAFSMDKGEVSAAPVKTQFGWHVIKVEDTRDQKPPAFDDVRPQIEQIVARRIYGDVVDELTAKVTVKRFAADGEPLPAEDQQQ